MGQLGTRFLSYFKGEHRFVVAYEAGRESQVMDELTAMVRRPELGFDWFDAAVMSHQLGQHLAEDLRKYLPKP